MARRYRLRYDTRALDRLSANIQTVVQRTPQYKRAFLLDVGNEAMKHINAQYHEGRIVGKRHPAVYQNEAGQTMRLSVAVGEKRSYANVIIDAPYWLAQDMGRRAGPIPPEVIRQWAQDKLGLDPDSREVKLILGAIWRHGTKANAVMRNSVDIRSPRGRAFSAYIDRRAQELATYMVSIGAASPETRS